MHKILKSIVKNILQFALFLAVLSVAADYWRRPSAPLDATAHPLSTLSGSSLTLAQHSSNQTVLLYFWGSWCGICRHTSPVIQKLHENGVAVLGVAVQSGSDADIRAYLDKQAWHFDNINDADGSLSRQWQMQVTPTIVLVRQGRVLHSTTGLSSYWGLKTRLMLAGWRH